MDQPFKVVKPARDQLYPCTSTYTIYVLVQYCCLYWFVYQVPVYFLFGGMYIRARFTSVYAYMCNYSGMYVELVYMYDHHNWARPPILLAVS